MNAQIFNARIVLPDRTLEQCDLCFENDKIISVMTAARTPCRAASHSYDFAGDTLIPGLIDLHVHGCAGSDVMDGDVHSLSLMAAGLLQRGTVAFLPTTMTAPWAKLKDVIDTLGKVSQQVFQAEILGAHLEGPCVAAAYQGAQKLQLDSEAPAKLDPRIKIVTLAPELPAAAAWLNLAGEAGVILSAGHSGASYEEMLTAIARGVYRLTHAFNAMPGIHHRQPGLLTAALLDERVSLELIADGVHIHPAVLELALRLKGVERICLVSDGTRAVGMPDGEYDLGGQRVRLDRGRMSLPDGTLAGSAATLLDGVRFMVEQVGRPLHEAVRLATLNPAITLGLAERLGSVLPGREATFLRLGQDLTLKEVWVRGCKIG